MQRGIGRLRARASNTFSPSQITFTTGLWLDPSDISTGFQDSAGTAPQTASGQPTGKRLDKSGNGNHVLQATSSNRPEYDLISGIASDFCDGVSDGYGTATFTAGTFGNSMDCFIAIKRASGSTFICGFQSSGAIPYFGAAESSDVNPIDSGAGAGSSYLVDGVAISKLRSALNTAVPTGAWHVIEIRGLDLSAWTAFRLADFAGFRISGDIGGVIICPAQSSANRNSLRTWLGAKVGLSL